ncbi:MAG: M36 family metallopeptidase [Chitinophagaceae bacterium]
MKYPGLQRVIIVACTVLCLLPKLHAQEIYSNISGENAVRQYFTSHKSQFNAAVTDVAELKITNENTDPTTGIRHIYVQQKLHQLDVINAVAALHIKQDGTPAHATYQFLKLANAPWSYTVITPQDAVLKAMEQAGITPANPLEVKNADLSPEQKTVFKASNTSWDIPVRKAYYLDKATNNIVLTWEVQLYLRDQQHYWIMYINGANGKLVFKQDMVTNCDFGIGNYETDEFIRDAQPTGPVPLREIPTIKTKAYFGVDALTATANTYRVFNTPYEAPNQAGATHALITTSGDALGSPDGWHKTNNAAAYQYTHGNNVWAFQDPSPGPLGGVPSADPTRTAYNNGGVGGTPAVTEPYLFDYAVNFNNDPTTYQNGAIVNLFYWNNLMHDVFYHFGFTEATQNFEESHNFSTGTNRGATPAGANDAVLAQAQDGGGTNNANFLTLADGTNGQMQMYLWTGSTPDSIVQINSNTIAPPPAGKKYFSVQGSFGNSTVANNDLYANPVLNKPFVIVQKNAAAAVGTSSEGCGTGQMSGGLPPANDVNGKIVLIDRGSCSFVEKVLGAQLGGAVGVIIINNVPGAQPIAMGGTDAPTNAITIPAVMISFEAGKELKAALVGGAAINGSLKKNINNPRRDGDLDNGVVAHEYGHGISTRLTAGGPNPTGHLNGGEQGGEGWSDNFALYMTTASADLQPATALHPNGILPNRGIGSYVVYQPHATGLGIRETQYSIDMNVNPSTFGYVKQPLYAEAHSIGYLWCTMLYDMQQAFIDQYGFNNDVYNAADPTAAHNVPAGAGGNNVAMRLVMEGLKLQPANPTFVQERDAILKADSLIYNGQHACKIWSVFAKRGLGYSAISGTSALGDEVEQFNTSPFCNPQSVLSIKKTAPSIMTNNEELTYTIEVKNVSPITLTASNLTVTDTLPALTTYISSDTGTNVGNVVSWPLYNLEAGQTITHTVTVRASHPTPATLVLNEDHEGATDLFKSTNTGMQNFNLISTGAFSGSKVWFVEDFDIPGSNATLESKAKITVPAGGAFLIFNHKYASESGYDGGVVETSVDSVNWVHLNTFTQNGYNGIITMVNNPSIGTANLPSFTGSSPGYIQSIASLNGLAGQSVFIRFRFTSDAAGGSVTGGGWWVDDVYLASGASFITNTAVSNAANASSKVTATASTLIINSPCFATLNQLIPTAANAYLGDGVCVDNFANWMHYYKGTNLLFSIKKTLQTSGITPANVKVGVDTGSAAISITAPYTTTFGNADWFVTRRYWNVTSATALTNPTAVRFYYTTAELDELKAKATNITSNANAVAYKIITQANPDPATGHASVQAGDVVYPATTYLGTNSNYNLVEFKVSQFSGGGLGGTKTICRYTFTGSGNWNVAANWSGGTIPPGILPAGCEIIVDPSSGQCILNVPQTVDVGGKITVKAGKIFLIQGNLTLHQ